MKQLIFHLAKQTHFPALWLGLLALCAHVASFLAAGLLLTGALMAARKALVVGVVLSFAALAQGCSSQITQHGHLLTDADLAQVQPGMSKQQVQFLLGTPDTTATYGGDIYYYISSKMETKAFLKPKEIDRRVVAVYFAPQIDTVQRVANYGLEDGKVIDFISRETPSHGKEVSLLKQLFRNLGTQTQLFGSE